MRYVSLPEIAEMGSGGTPSRKKKEYYTNGTIPWLKSGELNNSIVTKAEEFITEKALEESSAKIAPKGSLLVAMYGATAGKVGLLDFNSSMNQAVCFIKPDEIQADVKYLYYYLMSKNQELLDRREGGGQPNISQTILKSLEIPLPTLNEQKAIVAKLDRAQRLIDIDKEMLAKYDELIQSVFLEMFGDPVTNPKGWEETKLEDVITGTGQNGIFKKKKLYGEGSQVIWIGDFIDMPYAKVNGLKRVKASEKEIEKYKVNYGDILFCRSSLNKEGIGKASIVPKINGEEILFECHIIKLSVDLEKVVPEFLRVLSDTKYFRNQIEKSAKTSTMTTISQKGVKDCSIIIPPINSQIEFKSLFERLLNEKSQIRDSIKKSEELFSALVQEAFR